MSDTVIKVENIGKLYKLGEIGTGTMSQDLNRWWAKMRGKEDPFAKIGETNDRTSKGNSDWVWALKDVNFEVKQGEVLGIIGRNGAGKSTLLKILSKVTTPSTGRIKTKGRIASLLEVGTGFHPDLTGRENIFLNGAILGMNKAEIKSKFDEIVDFSGVERYIDTPVKRYSSGMYVRLAFAVAAFLEPEILIIDEVLAVGDAEFQKKCLGRMKDVSVNDGRTVLFVSHNMAAVSTLCNRGVLMQNGKVKHVGLVEDVLDKYINQNNLSEIVNNEMLVNAKDECFQIKNISIIGKNGSSADFGLDEEITCEIEYEVLKDNTKAYLSIHLLDRFGNCILASLNSDSANLIKDPLFGVELKKGVYIAKCTLPPNFLNNITYSLSVFLTKDQTWNEMIKAEQIISFRMYDTGVLSKDHTSEWIGLIRPRLKWLTQKL